MSTAQVSPLFATQWDMEPMGDQPQAIQALLEGLEAGKKEQVLLGVTGSGKTFTMANIIAKTNRPALIMAPNKTLAAQLYQEFKALFPNNCVEYFVSYYDFYQPEAYVPSTNTFIDKSSVVNDDIDKMRHSATRSLFERRDTIIVSSVSCIYGLGTPDEYMRSSILLKRGEKLARDDFIRQLLKINYKRNDISLERGSFRVRGPVIEIIPAYEKERALRVEFFGSHIERITHIDALRGFEIESKEQVGVYPATHYVLNGEQLDSIIENIVRDLKEEVDFFKRQRNFLEAERLEFRTLHDLEMLKELGYCQGIENYSRYLDNRPKGAAPSTLMDYFPDDYLLMIDESHVTVPQIGGMYRGDRARKETLVKYGFRLSSALDNRPLNFEEFTARMGQTIYVSATPNVYELTRCQYQVVEQIIRPTGLVDPVIEIRKATGQIDDLLEQIAVIVERKARVLVTALTKRLAEEVTGFFADQGVRVRYMHGDVDGLERIEILRDLRLGNFDVLVGINLLREGLDLPEVELVAILDADKEGFLRSKTSLIQTVGRAARNEHGRVIFYADTITKSMQGCLDETERRRHKQLAYNAEHNIQPKTIMKKIPENFKKLFFMDYGDSYYQELEEELTESVDKELLKNPKKFEKYIAKLTKEMEKSSHKMEFETAGQLRDKINLLKKQQLNFLQSQTYATTECET